jgi:hypothetical protein
VSIPGKPFQPSLMYVINAGAYPRGRPVAVKSFITLAPERLKGRLLALHTIVRLGWKTLPGTNTLAYYGHSYQCYKTFSVRNIRIFLISLSVCL